MPKEHRASFNYLLRNEVNALITTNIYEVPRVVRWIDEGFTEKGDDC